MPEIVPPEVFYTGSFQGVSPSLGIRFINRFPLVGEHPFRVITALSQENYCRNQKFLNFSLQNQVISPKPTLKGSS